MMRAAGIATIGAVLSAAAALAQQAPDGSATVPQPRFESEAAAGIDAGTGAATTPGPEPAAMPGTQPGTEPASPVAEQPRFVRAPEGGIVVTPLAPPGRDIPLAQPGTGGEAGIPPQGSGADPLGQVSGVEVLQPVPGEPVEQRRFRSAPLDDAAAMIRPTGPAVPIDPAPTDLRQGVRLRELDKMTGQTETFELAVGETRQVDRLEIRLEACRSPQGNDTHGTMAFLKVWDTREPEDEAFSGWMFAESPSISALDHPRYDLWVISCTISAVAESSPSE